MTEKKFWQTRKLDEMSRQEWESLCDGCGRCCLVKLEDEDSGEIYPTSVSCRLLDRTTCRCMDYDNRFHMVEDCLDLKAQEIASLTWLPDTCAYRLLHEGKSLASWHPLISGTRQSVIDAGISIAGKTLSEADVQEEELGNYIQEWPRGDKS